MAQLGIAGRVAVVSGAAQGIGAAVVASLAAAGARVVALDRNATGLTDLVAGSPVGHQVVAYRLDVSDSSAVDDVISAVEREIGPVELLANVAGVLLTGAVVDTTDEDWATVFAVNTTGVFQLSRAVARYMIPRHRGAIVTVGSNAAGVARKNMAAYAASKAASSLFTKCLGLELAMYGIRCNVVSPGSTDTPMQRRMWENGADRQRVLSGHLADHKVGIPLGKLAKPADVAAAVTFLLSEQASHITMSDVYVDGGASLKV
jgi:2,3-dihydro-2,3-dihydroxybenzoate dehydrogenase